jgi:hypothetical protein
MHQLPVNKLFEELSSEQGPDIEGLQDFLLQTHQNLLEDGDLAPVFAFHVGDTLNIAAIPGELMDNKPLVAAALKQLVSKYKPDYYWFVTEAWAAGCSDKDTEEHKKLIDEVAESGGVSHLPRSKRDEVVIFNVVDARQETPVTWIGVYKIIRDKQDVIHNFSPTRWIRNDKPGTHLEGTLVL